MVFTLDIWKKMLTRVAELFHENAMPLSELDATIGDGDHGITVGKIGGKILEEVNAGPANIKALFDDINMDLLMLPGGSACPLYGAYFGGFATAAPEAAECDLATAKAMFQKAYDEFFETSGAKPGDKTMMDALYPATEVIRSYEGDDAVEMLRQAAEAAKAGSEATVNFISKFGRAKSYKERTLGLKDPGSCSMALVYEGFAQAVEAL